MDPTVEEIVSQAVALTRDSEALVWGLQENAQLVFEDWDDNNWTPHGHTRVVAVRAAAFAVAIMLMIDAELAMEA